jgi:hypothetical protein
VLNNPWFYERVCLFANSEKCVAVMALKK